jgi:hypothetical protein
MVEKGSLWTEEEDKKLFSLFKLHEARWQVIGQYFTTKTASQVKNRFYSTLRRVATKQNNHKRGFDSSLLLSKDFLVKYVDDALEFGHNCSTKRGRKKKHPFVITKVLDEVSSISIKKEKDLQSEMVKEAQINPYTYLFQPPNFPLTESCTCTLCQRIPYSICERCGVGERRRYKEKICYNACCCMQTIRICRYCGHRSWVEEPYELMLCF